MIRIGSADTVNTALFFSWRKRHNILICTKHLWFQYGGSGAGLVSWDRRHTTAQHSQGKGPQRVHWHNQAGLVGEELGAISGWSHVMMCWRQVHEDEWGCMLPFNRGSSYLLECMNANTNCLLSFLGSMAAKAIELEGVKTPETLVVWRTTLIWSHNDIMVSTFKSIKNNNVVLNTSNVAELLTPSNVFPSPCFVK